MRHSKAIVIYIGFLAGCANSHGKQFAEEKHILRPIPSKLTQKKQITQGKEKFYCGFDNPDTYLSSIPLRDAESTTKVLKAKQLDGDKTHKFYSRNKRQILSVTVHPGDHHSQISIFQVSYAAKTEKKIPSTSVDHFTTEKNIGLGLTQKEVAAILGNCYTASSKTKNDVEITYRLASPQDSRTKVLERYRMPSYYAIYQFKDDKLIQYEFGFEYP